MLESSTSMCLWPMNEVQFRMKSSLDFLWYVANIMWQLHVNCTNMGPQLSFSMLQCLFDGILPNLF